MDIIPAIIMTMAITQAKMGRSIKNRDISGAGLDYLGA
jgi:hypothetical protein